MAEYRYYLIPDAMTRAFPEQFEKQTPTEFFDNIADLEKRYHQLREMPYNNERTWNERARFPYERLVVGVDRQNPDGAVAIIQVRNGINYLCDDYRGPYADGSDAQIPQMAKKLVEVIGVDRVRPHTYTQRDGYTWVQVEKDMHITEWLYAHELCSSLQFTRFLNRDGRELFQVRDGQRVIETNADGTKRIKVGIGRVLFKDAELIILDEPNAALDAISEINIFKAIKQIAKNRICIVITHRVSNVPFYADKVMVIDEGKVVGFETHDYLLKNCHIYNELYTADLKIANRE